MPSSAFDRLSSLFGDFCHHQLSSAASESTATLRTAAVTAAHGPLLRPRHYLPCTWAELLSYGVSIALTAPPSRQAAAAPPENTEPPKPQLSEWERTFLPFSYAHRKPCFSPTELLLRFSPRGFITSWQVRNTIKTFYVAFKQNVYFYFIYLFIERARAHLHEMGEGRGEGQRILSRLQTQRRVPVRAGSHDPEIVISAEL